MPLLPSVRVTYDVGLTTFSVPVQARTFGTAKHQDGTPALHLDHVTWNVFYPCDLTGATKHEYRPVPWLTRPLNQWAKGYSAFLGRGWYILLWLGVHLIGRFLKIPVHENAPILFPRNAKRDKLWPLVIFSHGMAGSKTTYSQICGKLASEGRIVVAIEHHDGSGPAFACFSTEGDVRHRFYVRDDILEWEQSRPEGLYPLRNDQLTLRHDEMYEAWAVMKRISLGDIKGLPVQRLSVALLEQWQGTFDPEELYLAGHSMGGAACVYVLSNGPPEGFDLLPIKKAVMFDAPMRMTDVPAAVHDVPIFCINSEPWTVWQGHLALLEAMLSQWSKGQPKGSSMLLTIVGCEHQSFSDFPVLFPAYTSARGFLEDTHQLTAAFLEGRLQEFLDANSHRVSHGLEIDDPGGPKRRKIRGRKRDFIVHDLG